MALLTAEDVLNKAFSKTKYREGFDQDEVDDFLDEVANTIAQLTAERDEAVSRAGSGAAAPAAVAAAPEAPPATAAGGVPGTTGLLAAATEPGGANPTGMLAMAQKLHDEYVQAGEAERDRIVDEAHASADQIRERADSDAKSRMDELAGERADLEGRIDDLRRFERDYRARLKSYLENLLGDLDHAGVAGAAGFAAASVTDDMPGGTVPGGDEQAPDDTVAAADVVSETGAYDGGFEEPQAYVVDDAVSTDSHESGDAEPDMVVIAEDEPDAPASFDEVLNEFQPEPATEAEQEAPPVPSNFDVNQPWESQLASDAGSAPASPFAPVNEPLEGEQPASYEDNPGVPGVAAEDDQEAPFTPPSSRMFNDLYGQPRPDEAN